VLQDLSAFLGIPPGRSRKTLHLLWNPYSATGYQIFLRIAFAGSSPAVKAAVLD